MKRLFWNERLDMLTGFSFSLFVILVVFVEFVIFNYIANKQCLTAYHDYKPQYSFMGGCRIDFNGKLTPVK